MSVTELRDHVDADPRGVHEEAIRRRRAARPPIADRARLHWVIGLAERELGRLDAAAAELRSGVALADESGEDELAGGLRMSLSLVVGRFGDLDDALALLDEAEPVLRGRRTRPGDPEPGDDPLLAGRLRTGRDDARRGLPCPAAPRRPGRRGRARASRWAPCSARCTTIGRAERHLDRGDQRRPRPLGQSLLVAVAHHNLGYLAMLQRDLPRAIAEFEVAETGLVEVGADGYLPRVHADHAQALADAGPVRRRRRAAAHERSRCSQQDGNEIEMAGALVTAAEIRLAQRDHAGARAAADEAAGWYRKQGREGWVAISTSLALQAAARDDEPPPSWPSSSTRSPSASTPTGSAPRRRAHGSSPRSCAPSRRRGCRRPGPCRHPSANPQRTFGRPHPARPRRRRRRAAARRSGGGTAGDQPWPERGDVEPGVPRVDRDARPRRRPRQRADGDRSADRRSPTDGHGNCWPASRQLG